MTTTEPLLLGRYGAAELLRMFGEAGVLAAVARRGYCDPAFELDCSEGPLTHARLFASKGDARLLLLDACLTELRLAAGESAATAGDDDVPPLPPLDLLVAYWLREQDPTASFDPGHERLPLQEHPGLGVLRLAFRVAVRIARQLGKNGIAALPKFFHDAAIFWRSRLFLFLDPVEQGRFEALLRDLSALSLADATLALAGGAVRDADGDAVPWQPGLQVMPLSPEVAAYFHDPRYAARCAQVCRTMRFVVDEPALADAREVFARSLAGPATTA